MLALCETHGRQESPTTYVPPCGYSQLESARSGNAKQGGGLLLLYRDNLNAHAWVPGVDAASSYVAQERQWLLITGEGGKKLAFLSCYLACQRTSTDAFLEWNIDLSLTHI